MTLMGTNDMADDKKSDPRTVQLKRLRLSFAEGLIEKKAATEDSEPKHSTNLVIECVGTDDLAVKFAEENKGKCLAAIKAACDHTWGKPDRWKNIQEDNPKRIAFRKGERFRNDDGQVYKGYEGNFVIAASGPRAGQLRPKMFDRHRVQLDASDPKFLERIAQICYSGCYVDAFVSFYGGDKGGAGVFASIEAIRSHQEGESTGGGGITVTKDMFDAFDDEGDSFAGASTGGGASDDAMDSLG